MLLIPSTKKLNEWRHGANELIIEIHNVDITQVMSTSKPIVNLDSKHSNATKTEKAIVDEKCGCFNLKSSSHVYDQRSHF